MAEVLSYLLCCCNSQPRLQEDLPHSGNPVKKHFSFHFFLCLSSSIFSHFRSQVTLKPSKHYKQIDVYAFLIPKWKTYIMQQITYSNPPQFAGGRLWVRSPRWVIPTTLLSAWCLLFGLEIDPFQGMAKYGGGIFRAMG